MRVRSILKPRTPSPADETPRRLLFRRISCDSAAAVARGWRWRRNRRPLASMVPAHGQVPCADASEAAPSCPQVSTPMALGFGLVTCQWHDTGRDLIS